MRGKELTFDAAAIHLSDILTMGIRPFRRHTGRDAGSSLGRARRSRADSVGVRSLRLERLEAREMLTATPGPLLPTAATTLSSVQVAEETAIAQSINAFGLELYAALQSQAGGSGNTVFSPLSISAALAMAYAGANGETATQMADVLHFAGDSGAVAQEFGTLLADLNSAGQGGNYTLSVADALWGQQGMQILAPFLETMQADFNGALQQVDFLNDPSGAVQTINAWVSQQTDGKIQQLLSSGAVTTFTRWVLTNAVYFNGTWATAFDPSLTQDAGFTLSSGSQVQVPMMNGMNGYGYMDSDGFQVLDLPYAGGRLSMDVILPNQGYSAAGLNVGQLPANLTNWLAGLQYQRVAVSLPKFDIDTQFELGGPLQSLGMTDAFEPHVADFSGITDPLMYISSVVHQATISVDEQGTVATGATGVVGTVPTVVVVPPPPIMFDANHPFLFLIRDDQSGSVLFMGQEVDPTSTTGDPSAPPVGAAPAPGPAPPVLPPVSPPWGASIRITLPVTFSPTQNPHGHHSFLGAVSHGAHGFAPTLFVTTAATNLADVALAVQETGSPTSGSTSLTAASLQVSAASNLVPISTTSVVAASTSTVSTSSTGSTTATASIRQSGPVQSAAVDAALSDFDLVDCKA